jgi:1-phosphofructokinase family hexose kinase
LGAEPSAAAAAAAGPPTSASVLLCITPSPAIDRTAHVERIVPGEVLRPLELTTLPGGKGVNAARAAARLGGNVMTTGIAGGHAGRWIVEALAAEGLDPHWSYARAESRTTYVTVDRDGASVIVYEHPAVASEAEFAAFLSMLEDELLPRCRRVIVAGSVPAGIDSRGHAAIVEVSRKMGRPLLVDAAGVGLVAALGARPDVVKVGRVEVEETGLVSVGATAMEAAASLVERGAGTAIVTDGRRQVAAADAEWAWRVDIPQLKTVNAVGSGDCFNAAWSLALLEGASMETALTRGVAAGSANALALGAGMLDPDVAQRLEGEVRVTRTRR